MTFIPPDGGPGTVGALLRGDLSVNEAYAQLVAESKIVLATSAEANPAGGFNGAGTGNKAIFGSEGFSGTALSDIDGLSYKWENVDGPSVPPTVATPYANMIVDFDPNGGGDVRILAVCDDSLSPVITGAVGTYTNNGDGTFTYAWDSSMSVMIVQSPPNPTPGGVASNNTVGAQWQENTYLWADLLAANPDAVLIDTFTGDGGMPAGRITPAVILASGDSNFQTRSGKLIHELTFDGVKLIGQ